jgi:uncharacterized protein YybS (DUF2232 family)
MPLRPVIFAALQAAALFVAGLLVPLLGQLAMLFVPVPLISVTVLHGRSAGILATLLGAFLVTLLGSWQIAVVFFVLGFGLMAYGISEGLLRNTRPETAIAVGSILPLLAMLAALVPVLARMDSTPLAAVENYLRSSMAEAQKLYTDLGAPEAAHLLAALSERFVFYIVRLLPGIILSTTLMQSAACYGIARARVLRQRPDMALAARPMLPFWHAPDTWVWALIATLGGIAAAPRGSAVWFGALNLSFIFLLVYTAQGVAVVEFFYRKARIPLLVRSILHALVLALPTVLAVVALGVVDIWADFRKVRPAAGPPSAPR